MIFIAAESASSVWRASEPGGAARARAAARRGPWREDLPALRDASRAFALAAVSLRQAMQDMPEIADISKNIIIEESKDGLDLSLVDQDGRAMFPEGGASAQSGEGAVCGVVVGPELLLRAAHAGPVAVAKGA